MNKHNATAIPVSSPAIPAKAGIHSKIKQALAALKKGDMILLVDDENRENEGDLIIAAEHITNEKMSFIIRYTSGIVCLCLTEEKVDALDLPPMVSREKNTSRYGTGFTVSIEAKEGVTTGVSAADRVTTVKAAIQANATPQDLARPGHVFPICAQAGGVLAREGHTEGSVDLMKLAGLTPAAVLCEVMKEDGTMARLPDLETFAEQHDLIIISIEDIKQYRLQQEVLIEKVSEATLPIRDLGDFKLQIFCDKIKKEEYVVLQRGDIDSKKPIWVRLHSQCLTGDVLGSLRCDCGWQLEKGLEKIAMEGGVFLYLAQEGRGIGLANKIKAYALQEKGMDTVEANHHLGFADDLREYAMSAQILKYLGVQKVRLLTNNPRKMTALEEAGLEVTREVLSIQPSMHNERYLNAKRDKLGHLL